MHAFASPAHISTALAKPGGIAPAARPAAILPAPGAPSSRSGHAFGRIAVGRPGLQAKPADLKAPEGRRPLAHELTHVVQQAAGPLLQRKAEEAAEAPPKPKCFTGCAQRWGLDTTCSRWGYQEGVLEHEPQFLVEVKNKKLKTTPCCNTWPWSVENYARRRLGLNGAASCPAQFGREIATVTGLDGTEVQVLCSDTISVGKVLTKKIGPTACSDEQFKKDGGELIEISPKAMADLTARNNDRQPVTVCFSGAKQDLCSHDGPGRAAFPEVDDCLSPGCFHQKDTPKLKDTGWPR